MAAVALRDAVAGDAAALACIYLSARQAALPGLVERFDTTQVAGWLAGHLMARHAVRLAEAEGLPVGYVGHGVDPQHGPMVFHLYIHPDWRRRGLGRLLLAEALSAHAGRLSLFCIARNAAARRFYETQGFRIIGRSDGAETEEGEPDLLYAISPTPKHGESQ
ncbi:GNAT family N-acetyltransferase [Falsiroseomonas tokyonensis]|uniref:GNAT family N-acetyltransferase n=1 Tax=Falsiroseomonas tokyonensis TaxID=430521 RepID=A0ABV7BT13_9PROT|nr:GNAT family N-acetyltransferase [Falsiroseomonas tokyonensis]MBU8537635.1 GNAT family N-acetyltransferase [Falsiroseomonas tokyonensis]